MKQKKSSESIKDKSLDPARDKQLHNVRHSLSHLLATAVLETYPDTKLGIGPVIENGFYYDFEFSKPITDEILSVLEKRMRELVKEKLTFSKKSITPAEVTKKFKNAPYKKELIADLKKQKKPLSIYETARGTGKNKMVVFMDLCSGPHVKNTSEIPVDAFKLMSIAGAYWRGDEKNKMLTRIYGVAFESKKELDEYIHRMEEAAKRDHRKLGKELDLFHMDEMVGLGLPLWHPKGALLWRIIEEFWYQKHLENGYDLVRSPHIGNRSLWEISGHWGFYNKSMYPPIEAGQTLEEKQQNKKAEFSEEYLLKPMNCPFHVQIYKSNIRSYRDLPYRWAECGTVYRFEKKGELSGLTRVRGFTQDDAHIMCRKDQIEDELKLVIDFILFIYKSFGFDIDKIHVFLSLRDPKNKKKYSGNDAGWNFTETVLRKVAKEKKLNFKEELGEAAFYGPKLDFKIEDAIGRQWQCSTLQFDFNLPARFKMSFINDKGKEEQPFMLHRALFGSYERFIGLLIEHYAGNFPVWLAPKQVRILPVSERHADYAHEVAQECKANGIRVEVDDASETLGKRIRSSEMEKIPYTIVVGDKEIESKSVNVRTRHQKETETISTKECIEKIKKVIEEKK
ncbi:threonine--tRNA ligase [Candidatus Parcubacteria bacterium]|nr:MAG: threonine--tRNA ligase [Candidatus Parcubacteria bacterium]